MSVLSSLGIGSPRLPGRAPTTNAIVLKRIALRRILNFTGFTIDDVINDPFARHQVREYYNLHCAIERECLFPTLMPMPAKVRL